MKIFEEKVSVGRLRRVLEEALDEAMTEVDLGLRVILAACLAFNMGAPPWGKGCFGL
ncbi:MULTISPECIES: hypothetical protein [unclassified Bartonella]|uniref:hypothetical protein n=1 Tax=unclassified Bartonella TaxID=2645622 RepID=UPI0023609E6A|nr:hypothetical protein [Bartonella sp. CM31XJBT]